MGRTFYKPVGTDEEEDKYRKICDLLFKIELFEQLKEYLSNIDRFKKIWYILAIVRKIGLILDRQGKLIHL